MKIEKYKEAVNLRLEGRSLKEIATLLSVSKSSVSVWVRNIELTEEQTKKLIERNPACKAYTGIRKNLIGTRNAEEARSKRKFAQNLGKQEAIKNNALHQAGCMLYWAEGAKSRNSVAFSNYDPNMIKFFIKFMRDCFHVENCRFKLWVHSYKKDFELDEKFWLNLCELPLNRIGKTTLISSCPKKKKNRHDNGGCKIAVNDTQLVQRIYGSIKYYAGIDDENLWLD